MGHGALSYRICGDGNHHYRAPVPTAEKGKRRKTKEEKKERQVGFGNVTRKKGKCFDFSDSTWRVNNFKIRNRRSRV